MTQNTMTEASVAAEKLLFDDWTEAIEGRIRAGVRGFIEAILEEELEGVVASALCASPVAANRANEEWQLRLTSGNSN